MAANILGHLLHSCVRSGPLLLPKLWFMDKQHQIKQTLVRETANLGSTLDQLRQILRLNKLPI